MPNNSTLALCEPVSVETPRQQTGWNFFRVLKHSTTPLPVERPFKMNEVTLSIF